MMFGLSLLNAIGFSLLCVVFVLWVVCKKALYLYQNVSPRAKTPPGLSPMPSQPKEEKSKKNLEYEVVDRWYLCPVGGRKTKAKRKMMIAIVSCRPGACHGSFHEFRFVHRPLCARFSHVTKSVLFWQPQCWRPTDDWTFADIHGKEFFCGKREKLLKLNTAYCRSNVCSVCFFKITMFSHHTGYFALIWKYPTMVTSYMMGMNESRTTPSSSHRTTTSYSVASNHNTMIITLLVIAKFGMLLHRGTFMHWLVFI